jgi:amino acid transporter
VGGWPKCFGLIGIIAILATMSDLWAFLLLFTLLMVPAVVTFSIFTYIRVRRNSFHRQRMPKKHEDEK